MIIPNHVAIIMDGNGRWALKKGLQKSNGYLEGSRTLEKITFHAFDRGIKFFSVYAFSIDNFKRDVKEVDYLINLMVKFLKSKLDKFNKKGIKVVFSGRKYNLSDVVIQLVNNIEEITKNNEEGIFNICFNYGGQEEIVDGAVKLAKDINNGLNISNFTKKDFYKYMYNDLPPVDLLIRTGGELRISNFMLYQLSYSEFYFTNTLFPDFDKSEFNKALFIYETRDCKIGGNYEEGN